MDTGFKTQFAFRLIAVATVLLMLAGCSGDANPRLDSGIGFDNLPSELSYNSGANSDGRQPNQYNNAPQMLEPSAVLSLSAGTIISWEQIDEARLSEYFVSIPIYDDVYNRIYGKSYIDNPYVSLDDLRYLKLLHYNFEHQIQVGELIVSVELDGEFLEIFLELFYKEYEIQSMFLVDDYWTGDAITTDDASIAVNNTSAFSYRIVPESGNLSRHAFGKAIDINPRQNPYVEYYDGVPYCEDENAFPYIDRYSGNDHMISHYDDCYIVFSWYGYIWGGDWYFPLDYQHFEK